MKTEDCPSLERGRCGKHVVLGIDRFCSIYVRPASCVARGMIVPVADRVRYSPTRLRIRRIWVWLLAGLSSTRKRGRRIDRLDDQNDLADVYVIGSAGVPVLIEHGYAPREFKEERLRHHELTEIGIRHSLFIADIHARLL